VTTGLDLDALLSIALDAARVGGEIILDAFGTHHRMHEKGPGDWVSDVDTASERAIRESLLHAAPDLPVFGEEEGG
jgi:myo-inositol-1(or 4)-monophosphatase